MAGTIVFNSDFTVNNGANQQGPTYVRASITQTNAGGPSPGTVTATTVAAAITPSASTLGICRVVNLDSTNFVKIGPMSGGTLYPFMKLKPSEPPFIFRLMPGITIGVQSDTANCKVNIEIYED